MKFSNVIRGKRAEKLHVVPNYFVLVDPNGDPDAVGALRKPFEVLLRPLTGTEQETAYATARDRAKDKGSVEARFGDPIFDMALMASILVVGCVDPDSPPDARTPSFSSVESILSVMSPEDAVLLHEHHDAWQDECSPTNLRLDGRGMSDDDLLAKVREVAGPDGQRVFMRFSPSTRVLFATSMARLLLTSLVDKSSPGGDSASNGPS